MMRERLTREAMLEAGILTSFGLVVIALGMFAINRSAGRRRRWQRSQQAEPEPGSISPTRHQQIAVSSPR